MDTILDLYESGAAGPKYKAVADAIRKSVSAGLLSPGDKLPPVRDLAWRLGITPGTVARAYTILTDEGAAVAEVGRGTFVADARPAQDEVRDIKWAQHQIAEDTDLVSLFSPKLPDCGQIALIHDAFARLPARPPRDLLNYPSRKGFEPARRAVLRWLDGTVLGPLNHEDVVLTHGGQSGVGLVMQAVLKGRRPVVLVEELSYAGFRRAAQLLRADVVSVPMDDQGIIPEALNAIAERHEAQLLCCSPEVHNPTGIITPNARREAIAKVAQRRGFHILEDDCYRMGRPNGAAYRSLLPEQGWHVSSISKTLTPALRIGFAVAPRAHASTLRRAAEYGFFGLARPLADLLEDLLTRDQTYVIMEDVRVALGRYVRAAVNILGRYDIRWHEDIPYIWLSLPDGWRASGLVQAAESQGVQLRPAEDFALRDGNAPHAVRLAINAQVSLGSFEAALMRLRGLLDNPPETIGV